MLNNSTNVVPKPTQEKLTLITTHHNSQINTYNPTKAKVPPTLPIANNIKWKLEWRIVKLQWTHSTPTKSNPISFPKSSNPSYIGYEFRFSVVKVLLLLPPTRFGSPTLAAKASTSGDISQLPLFLPQLDLLGCIPARSPGASTVVLISGAISPNSPSFMFIRSLLLSCASQLSAPAAMSSHTVFLPISMSSTAFPIFGLIKPPPAGLAGNPGSLCTFSLK